MGLWGGWFCQVRLVRLVADGEAGALVLWVLEFVYESDGVVGEGDFAVALGVGYEIVEVEAELAGAGTGLEEGCGLEASPVDIGFFDELEGFGVGLSDGEPFGGDMAAGFECDAGRDEEAAGSSDVEEALGSCLFDRVDEVLRDGD